MIKSYLPPGGHNASNLKQTAAGPGERLQGVRGGEKALRTSRRRGCKEISAGGAAGEQECGDHSRFISPGYLFHVQEVIISPGYTLLQVQEEPGSQQFLSRGLAEGWERCLTDDSVPYFVSHGSSSTQWDHPAFVTLLAQLAAMNTVKFSAYRYVAKLLSRVLLYYCNVLLKGWP